MSAYADDVIIFLRDTDSLTSAVSDFEYYARLSGANLDATKSAVLRLGNAALSPHHNFKIFRDVKILDVNFAEDGVSQDMCHELVDVIKNNVALRARSFNFSFSEKSCLIKWVFWLNSNLPPGLRCLPILFRTKYPVTLFLSFGMAAESTSFRGYLVTFLEG